MRAGIGIVLRRQLQGRSLLRDLLWAALVTTVMVILAALLQSAWPERNESGDFRAGLLQRRLTTSLLCAAPLFLAFASVLGAGAAPPAEELEATQAVILTTIRSYEIVLGRVLASLRPVFMAVAISCVFWMLSGVGREAVLSTHLALSCGVFMVGESGFLCALRRRPGRAWGRGAGCALIWTAFCITAILLINPLVRRMEDPVRLIESALLINPECAVSVPLKLDLLRTPWLYAHTDAPEYEFAYPPPLASAALFVTVGLIAQGLASYRLSRAYRR